MDLLETQQFCPSCLGFELGCEDCSFSRTRKGHEATQALLDSLVDFEEAEEVAAQALTRILELAKAGDHPEIAEEARAALDKMDRLDEPLAASAEQLDFWAIERIRAGR